ncbi:uncharacterized protein LOC108713828 [Xenopus laevis]|uniref:Uncharacterized protein LOC108713828 n=1 Tax=Xenopus laevis TaxID=8355 RepID=A0A8J0V0B9_XENLA|nr:uncharacterized protein LOC108713828 [Xenopus laevis]
MEANEAHVRSRVKKRRALVPKRFQEEADSLARTIARPKRKVNFPPQGKSPPRKSGLSGCGRDDGTDNEEAEASQHLGTERDDVTSYASDAVERAESAAGVRKSRIGGSQKGDPHAESPNLEAQQGERFGDSQGRRVGGPDRVPTATNVHQEGVRREKTRGAHHNQGGPGKGAAVRPTPATTRATAKRNFQMKGNGGWKLHPPPRSTGTGEPAPCRPQQQGEGGVSDLEATTGQYLNKGTHRWHTGTEAMVQSEETWMGTEARTALLGW